MSATEKAVEAAARARYATIRGEAPWEEAHETTRNSYMADVRKEVSAAAPLLQAAAWAEGYEDGLIDGDPAIQSKIERGVARATHNPYQETE